MNTKESTRLSLIDVAHIGHRPTTAFVSRRDGTGGVEEISLPVYPTTPRGDRMRALRRRAGISPRDAATLLGLGGGVDVLYLEQGNKTMTDADWDRALGALEALPTVEEPVRAAVVSDSVPECDDSTPEGRAELLAGGIPCQRWPECDDLAQDWGADGHAWCATHLP